MEPTRAAVWPEAGLQAVRGRRRRSSGRRWRHMRRRSAVGRPLLHVTLFPLRAATGPKCAGARDVGGVHWSRLHTHPARRATSAAAALEQVLEWAVSWLNADVEERRERRSRL